MKTERIFSHGFAMALAMVIFCPACGEAEPVEGTGGSTGQGGGGVGGSGSESTSLSEDCRSKKGEPMNQATPCLRPGSLEHGDLGEGPTLGNLPGVINEINGGFVHDGKLVAGVQWGDDQGLIMEFDLATGDREILSGAYDGMATVGQGDPFLRVLDVERGSDGTLFAYSNDGTASGARSIIAVDPATGDRTIVWDGTVLCENGGVPSYHSMALGDDGSFYLGVQGNPGGSGSGVVKIAPAGDSCEIITLTGADDPTLDVGSGTDIPGTSVYQDLTFYDGSVYALHHTSESILQVDVADGARSVVSSSSSTSPVGEGPDLGTQSLSRDDSAFYTVDDGTPADIVATDPNAGDRKALGLEGPASYSPNRVWPHPTDSDLLAAVFDDTGVGIVEISNGNSNTISY